MLEIVTIMSTVLALIGACVSTLVAWQFVQRVIWVRNSVVVAGEVVTVGEVKDGIESGHAPRVKFRTLTGLEVSFDACASSRAAEWKPGSSVKVRYQPGQPDAAEIDSFLALWLAPCALAVVAMVFWFVGVGIIGGVLRV